MKNTDLIETVGMEARFSVEAGMTIEKETIVIVILVEKGNQNICDGFAIARLIVNQDFLHIYLLQVDSLCA